jgi:hypothetical protein
VVASIQLKVFQMRQKIFKPKATKICVAEFDPPPLLETVLALKMVGLRENKRFI